MRVGQPVTHPSFIKTAKVSVIIEPRKESTKSLSCQLFKTNTIDAMSHEISM